MDPEEFEDLHVAIGEGDLESVRGIVENHREEHYFSFEETSALYTAFQCKKYEIISFLIHEGAKFVGSEERYVYHFDIDLNRLNHHLFDYNQKSEKSCIYRLMSLSQSPQAFDGERLNALMTMYEHFFQSDIIKWLMKVLENEPLDIVFDFESVKVNRVHRLYNEDAEIFGLTLCNSKEIFIGAENLLSDNPRNRAKVYGVVAEELCHLAMTNMFQNNAKPYREEDSGLIREFHGIVLAMKSLAVRSCHLESVLPDVYECYSAYDWECELIARVPHVIGIYGETFGRRIFKECSELSRLLTFYDKNVLPKCREYADPSVTTKSDRILRQLMAKTEYISFKERRIRPLKESFPSFREYVVVQEGVSVIATNCTKLCALHVYHELRDAYGEQMERKCLFFGSECFEKKRDEILSALKHKICEYLVLVLDDRELHQRRLLCEYLDHFEELENEGMNVIVISNSQFIDPEIQKKAVKYKWDNLTDEYKDFRTLPVEYIFKGERQIIYIKKENVPELFSEEDIITIISGDLIEVNDGANLDCPGYNCETYVERQFQTTIIERKFFENTPADTSILIYGLCSWEFEEFSINESLVQWLKGPDDEIQKEKAIFIGNAERPMSFKDFAKKTAVKNSICLQRNGKLLYLMSSTGDVCKRYQKEARRTEEEMIDFLKSNKTLIITDNAGCGKSTAVSSLIRLVKKTIYSSWVFVFDLNKFLTLDCGPDSEEDDEEEVFEDAFIMLGLKNGLEKSLFRKISSQGRYFIFLDAFDEVSPKCKTKALKLISFLRKSTRAKMIITTRLHHQQELEESLNAYSHHLVPLDHLSQVNYLGKFWKWKLKFPSGQGRQFSQRDKKAISRKIESIIGELEGENANSESRDLIIELREIKLEDGVDLVRMKIDDLEFTKLASCILNKTLLDKETLEFMGVPLHLFMIAIIYFDNNFNVEIDSDIYGIYSKFIEQKIQIFVEDKEGMSRNRFYDEILKKTTEDAYKIHVELADQLMEVGKLDANMVEKDLEMCASLGIVFISGEKIDFLHHTFAEFFKAESIRLNPNKDLLIEVLYNDKYKVIRRFISSSLEKKNFENPRIEFFTDLDFLFSIIKRFIQHFSVYKNVVYDHGFALNATSVAKIVNCLFKTTEETFNQDLNNAFVLKLKSELLPLKNWFCIGGCFTVRMMKIFLERNFSVNFKMIFGVVRYYSSPEDVIDLLTKCISIESANESDTNERGYENVTAESLLKLSQIWDSKQRGLIEWAIWNPRAEILAKILEFFMDILGKERFINVIVRGAGYRRAINEFLGSRGFNSSCVLLKEFRSVFGNEIEILFENYLKLSIIKSTLNTIDESSDEFEEALGLFVEYFGNEKVKEVLLDLDVIGEYLFLWLASKSRNVIKNLNIVRNILNDKNKMIWFLKDKKRRRVFNIAVENEDINFGEFLQYCGDCLPKSEIKEMLASGDIFGVNVLHSLFKSNAAERLIENVSLIKYTLEDDVIFKKILMSKDLSSMNIFHFVAYNEHKISISFLNMHLHIDEIKNLLTERDMFGNTCLNCGKMLNGNNLPVLLDYSFETLKSDESRFEELVLAVDEDGNTLLHHHELIYRISATEEKVNFVNAIILSLKEKLSHDAFKKLVRVRNAEGKTFLQIDPRRSEKIIKGCERILEKKLLEELLKSNENACVSTE